MTDAHRLLALSPLDGRYATKVDSLNHIMSEYGLIRYRIIVEITWLTTLCEHPSIATTPLDSLEMDYLHAIIDQFSIEDAAKIKQIEKTTNHDVKAVEYFLQDKLNQHPTLGNRIPLIHFAATSEDINNLAYALMLKDGRQVIAGECSKIMHSLGAMAKSYSNLAMLSRTHGQTASPTTLGKEIANVLVRLKRELAHFQRCDILGTFNGAVGNYNAHVTAYPEIDWFHFTQHFVEDLGLTFNPMTTQIEPHDGLAQLLDNLARINTILIDLNKDMWTYISLDYFILQKQADEVGSSTMPHKINPIDFENSEGNLGIANALATHLARSLPISRLQRDLSDSTALRNLGSVFGYSLLAYSACLKGLSKVTANQAVITNDLEARWEVLAEAIQTVLRRYGVQDAYESLKELTRGKVISQTSLHEWLQQQALPQPAKDQLIALTPTTYTGLASTLAVKYLDD